MQNVRFNTQNRRSLVFAGFFLALGVTLPHVILSPPFQAADEPSHFLGHAAFLSTKTTLRQSALNLAQRSYFDKIHRDANRQFSFADTPSADTAVWSSRVSPTTMPLRSLTTHHLWMIVSELSLSDDAANLLIKFRSIHSLLFAGSLAFMMIFCLLNGYSISTSVIVLLIPLTIPSLSFFAMHMSNYGLLTSAYCLTIGGTMSLSALARRTSLTHLIGAGFSAGFVLLIPSLFASSGISIAPFSFIYMLISCGIFLFLNNHDTIKNRLNNSLILAVSYILGLACFFHLTSLSLETNINPVVTTMKKAKLILIYASICSTLLVGILSIAWNRLLVKSHLLTSKLRKIHAVLETKGAILVLGVSIFLLILPQIISAPQLTNIENEHFLSSRRYMWDVCRLFFLNLASPGTDLYLSATFWSGFGWLEKMYPPHVMALTKALPLGLLIAGAFLQWKRTASRNFLWLYILGSIIATFPALMILAKGYYDTSVNVHGRYLIGIFLSLILIFGLYFGSSLKSIRKTKFTTALFYILMIMSKSYAYWFLAKRYIS